MLTPINHDNDMLVYSHPLIHQSLGFLGSRCHNCSAGPFLQRDTSISYQTETEEILSRKSSDKENVFNVVSLHTKYSRIKC